MVNRRARSITGMLKTTAIGPLVKETALCPAVALLDRRQRQYTLRLLGLSKGHPAQAILPIGFREGDYLAQPGNSL
jgi:hypothetical protein